MKTRVFYIKGDGILNAACRLVRATSRQQALCYLAEQIFTVRVAKQQDLIEALTAHIEIEDATRVDERAHDDRDFMQEKYPQFTGDKTLFPEQQAQQAPAIAVGPEGDDDASLLAGFGIEPGAVIDEGGYDDPDASPAPVDIEQIPARDPNFKYEGEDPAAVAAKLRGAR